MHTDRSKNRRDNRIQTKIECILVQSSGDECAAVIIDISRRGFRIRVSDCPDVGDMVRLLVDGAHHRGQIEWVGVDEAGGIFLDHADLAD